MAGRGLGARRKGANFEREIANYLSEKTGLKARRGLAQTRGGGAEVGDVDIPYLQLELKRHKRCNIKAALRQAVDDCKEKERIPVAVTKDDRGPILVTMLIDDWVEMFSTFVQQRLKDNG